MAEPELMGYSLVAESIQFNDFASSFYNPRELFAAPNVQASSYIMVAASLPALDQIDSNTPLLTELALEQRLRLLSELDQRAFGGVRHLALAIQVKATIARERLLAWRNDLFERSDCGDFLAFMDFFFRARTLLAVCRSRSQGRTREDMLDSIPQWALCTSSARHYCQNWHDASFAASEDLSELVKSLPLLEASPGDFTEAYYHLLWNKAAAMQQNHWFDFDYIAFYVVRWKLAYDFRRFRDSLAGARLKKSLGKIVSGADALLGLQLK